MITRRLKHLTIALLLPLLVLRAMLPAGYMPVADADGLRIVMCSASLPASLDDSTGSGHELPPNAGECAFAHSAGAAPPVSIDGLQVFAPAFNAETIGDYRSPDLPIDRPRAHAARGPPALS